MYDVLVKCAEKYDYNGDLIKNTCTERPMGGGGLFGDDDSEGDY